MFDFGDEVTIESYRIPWLIWIQILVLLLLIMLLYGFTLFVLDFPETPSSVSQLGIIPVFSPTTELASQVVEKQSIMGEIGISRGACRSGGGGGDESVEMEEDRHGLHHPCHYFRLAKLAFLKCLGLDFLSSDNAEQR
ncbi:hypothetical protein like AT5G64880 [Hibiscus trionum]|uniref:Uncharacterized protein n=1 Tax=Hibiscus trionum TaxID=183268 RepID=A0A9W7H024_HIBTR|nr:hypothetical protein like AT5G64880 [Hibiscus trionum]